MCGVLTLFKTPSLWFGGVLVLSVIDALMAVTTANAGFDYSLHETYYVVAHVHYMLSLAATFLIFALFYLLFRRIFGVDYNEVLGRIHFGTTFIGALTVSLPWAVLNLAAMPRRGFDPVAAFAFWNSVASFGYLLTLLGTCMLIPVVVDAVRRRRAYAGHRNER